MTSQRVLFLTSEISELGTQCLRWLCSWWGPNEGHFYLNSATELPDRVAYSDWDLAVSVGYRHILTKDQIALFPRGVCNLHLSYLPWNRGAYPNVFSIAENTPAGVTLHVMDEGIDTGPIIAQQRVDVYDNDTAETLYHRLNDAAFALFKEHWPSILDGTAVARPQAEVHPDTEGTYHTKADLDALDISRLGEHSGPSLLRRLRARTFSGYSGLLVEGNEMTISIK